jgi:colicin import membrane protein
MPRKLKIYQTSIGFFDLAIAAPSMKAALEVWGVRANLFHKGFAKQTDDPAIVAATMANPGIVLKRAVGSNGGFSEHAELPGDLTGGKRARPGMVADQPAIPNAKDQKRRDSERRRQAAAQEAEQERRAQAIAKAETALKGAKRIHAVKTEEIAAARSELDRQSKAEEARWDKQRAKLEAALTRATE